MTYDGAGIDAAMARILADSALAAEVDGLDQHLPALGTWLKASL